MITLITQIKHIRNGNKTAYVILLDFKNKQILLRYLNLNSSAMLEPLPLQSCAYIYIYTYNHIYIYIETLCVYIYINTIQVYIYIYDYYHYFFILIIIITIFIMMMIILMWLQLPRSLLKLSQWCFKHVKLFYSLHDSVKSFKKASHEFWTSTGLNPEPLPRNQAQKS